MSKTVKISTLVSYEQLRNFFFIFFKNIFSDFKIKIILIEVSKFKNVH